MNHNVANFDLALATWKSEVMAGEHYEDQIEYLKHLKKPPELDPRKVLRKLQVENRQACELADAPLDDAGLTDLQMRRAFVQAMPASWQTAMRRANLHAHRNSLVELVN